MCWRGWIYDAAFNTLLRGPRRRIARELAETRSSPALDVCCGTGSQSGEISRAGVAAVGLDLDFGILKYALARRSGVSFVCGDATSLPFRTGAFGSVVITLALHDKRPDARSMILGEARRVLAAEGRLIIMDFEVPWSPKARLASFLISLVERLAGREHFRNGREFLSRGGLKGFLLEHGLRTLSQRTIEVGSLGLAAADFRSGRRIGHPDSLTGRGPGC